MENYYELLGVYPPIDKDALRDSYRKAIFQYHPDLNPGRSDWALDMTMKIVEAFRILSDETRRMEYDFALAHPVRRDVGKLEHTKKLMGLGKEKEEVTQARRYFMNGLKLASKEEGLHTAVMNWRQAVKLLPDMANAWYNMSVILFQMRQFKDSELAMGKAKSLDSEDKKIAEALDDIRKLRAKVRA